MKAFIVLSLCFLSFSFAGAQAIGETEVWICRIGLAGNVPDFSEGLNLSNRKGYDNQPAFSLASDCLYFVSMEADSQTEVYCAELEHFSKWRLTNTSESEYSPTPLPGEAGYSVVRVEKDSTQRIWKFADKKRKARPVFPHTKKVGYHAWLGKDSAAVFILNEPRHILGICTGKQFEKIDSGIGRCLAKVPGECALSYVQKEGTSNARLMKYSLPSQQKTLICELPAGTEDYAWSPWNTIWAFEGGRLKAFDPRQPEKGWKALHDFSGLGPGQFYRLAISPDGKFLAMVSIEGKKP